MKFEHNGVKIPQSPVNKDPDSKLNWGCNWVDELAAGEVITASTWTITPTGLTVDSNSFTDTSTEVYLTGGTVGVNYLVTNKVTTAQRIDERSMYILCQQT